MSVGQAIPVRMCVGCRVRSVKTELLRIVVVEGALVPDPRGRLPGRGASLHPTLNCLDLAERRRAFPRAFGLRGPLDASMVRDHIQAAQEQTVATEQTSRANRECKKDEHRVGSGS